jgi:hypothetical protein
MMGWYINLKSLLIAYVNHPDSGIHGFMVSLWLLLCHLLVLCFVSAQLSGLWPASMSAAWVIQL